MIDMTYIIIVVLALIIGLGAQAYVNHMLNKYRRYPTSSGLTGAQITERMLNYYGANNVAIRRGKSGQDCFDPRSDSIALSPEAYNEPSITALATACHEAGHACQYADNYRPMKIRGSIVPIANVASNVWIFVLILGIFLVSQQLILLAVIIYAAVVIFQLVTLPVEFNASHRAMTYMETIGLPAKEQKEAFSVLRACALTYVAAALTSILQLLWLLGQTRR